MSAQAGAEPHRRGQCRDSRWVYGSDDRRRADGSGSRSVHSSSSVATCEASELEASVRHQGSSSENASSTAAEACGSPSGRTFESWTALIWLITSSASTGDTNPSPLVSAEKSTGSLEASSDRACDPRLLMRLMMDRASAAETAPSRLTSRVLKTLAVGTFAQAAAYSASAACVPDWLLAEAATKAGSFVRTRKTSSDVVPPRDR